ncbi:MAG TPA: L,D-transpeptidase, partial [Actinomycetota bacterium]|nr:L,D-transpeptidase [Actinomycetota bacterium]
LKPPSDNSIYGKFAYGLSAYAEAADDWYGNGVIGLHGTNDPTSVGRPASHGCIRMRNEDITELARLLPLGTPILIR